MAFFLLLLGVVIGITVIAELAIQLRSFIDMIRSDAFQSKFWRLMALIDEANFLQKWRSLLGVLFYWRFVPRP